MDDRKGWTRRFADIAYLGIANGINDSVMVVTLSTMFIVIAWIDIALRIDGRDTSWDIAYVGIANIVMLVTQ